MATTCYAVSVALFLVATVGSAAAQSTADDGSGPRASQSVPPPVPDATLQALRGRTLAITQRNGACVVGELLGYDATSVTLATLPTHNIMTLPRAEVAGLRLAEGAPAATAASPSVPTLIAVGSVRERHFGLQLGLAPGLMLDCESGHFYGFVHADAVLPMASSGDLLGFSVGGGVTFSVIAHSRWKMDVFFHFDPVRLGSTVNLGAGVGLGFHYTASNGFTLGFKVPIIGYSGNISSSNDAASGVAWYYLGGLMGLPVISLGYRF